MNLIKLSNKLLALAITATLIGSTNQMLATAMINNENPNILATQQKKPKTNWTDQGKFNTAWYDQHLNNNTYKIYTPQDLAGLCVLNSQVDSWENKTIELMNDLDMGENIWIPIGNNEDFAFDGTFDGNGHTISNLVMEDHITNSGLFVYNMGTIKNITIADSNFIDTHNFGAISTYNFGTIKSCINKCNITTYPCTSTFYSAGIVSSNSGTIFNCKNFGKITGHYNAGGIVGQNQCGIVTHNVNCGKLIATCSPLHGSIGGIIGLNHTNSLIGDNINQGEIKGSSNVGGIIGENTAENFENNYPSSIHNIPINDKPKTICNNTNKAKIEGYDKVGGIIGYNNTRITMTANINQGEIIGDSSAGGIVGYNNQGKITKSYNIGNINGFSYIGGIVGYNYQQGEISNSYNKGNITSTSNGAFSAIGGILGYNCGPLINIYNTGNITSNANQIGGIVGLNGQEGTITNSYNLGNISSGTANCVGGIVGQNNNYYIYKPVIKNCYNIDSLTSEKAKGIIGFNNISDSNDNVAENCYYYDKDNKHNYKDVGQYFTKLETLKRTRNLGLEDDFIDSPPHINQGYPRLRLKSINYGFPAVKINHQNMAKLNLALQIENNLLKSFLKIEDMV